MHNLDKFQERTPAHEAPPPQVVDCRFQIRTLRRHNNLQHITQGKRRLDARIARYDDFLRRSETDSIPYQHHLEIQVAHRMKSMAPSESWCRSRQSLHNLVRVVAVEYTGSGEQIRLYFHCLIEYQNCQNFWARIKYLSRPEHSSSLTPYLFALTSTERDTLLVVQCSAQLFSKQTLKKCQNRRATQTRLHLSRTTMNPMTGETVDPNVHAQH